MIRLIEATLACPKCEEVFKKEFPLDLEGLITESNAQCVILLVRLIFPPETRRRRRNSKAISSRQGRRTVKKI
jgi:hypothetical protein